MAYPKSIENGKTARNYPPVSPDNDNDLPDGECCALFIGTGGNLVCVDASGAARTFKNLPNGYTLSVQTKRVKATGTTASDILALY